MADIVELKRKPSENVIKVLEQWLAEAKTGHLQSVLVISETATKGLQYSWSETIDIPTAVGHLEFMKVEMIENLRSRAIKDDIDD